MILFFFVKFQQMKVTYQLTDARAQIPSKKYPTDTGYDITCIEKVKRIQNNGTVIEWFDTGLIVTPQPGYYLEIIPRSSIVKTSYILKNSVGVIDETYTGTLKVILEKTNVQGPSLIVPFKIAQLVLRKRYDIEFETKTYSTRDYTNINPLGPTENGTLAASTDTKLSRGTNGFGSTTDKPFDIYSDGSCPNNGCKTSIAGCGVFYGLNDARNVSIPVPPEYKQTNNTAELYAAIVAFNDNQSVAFTLYTDSTYVLNGYNKWMDGWKKNGWRKSNGKSVKNVELWSKMYTPKQQAHVDTQVKYVRGHSGNPGNDAADALATAASS